MTRMSLMTARRTRALAVPASALVLAALCAALPASLSAQPASQPNAQAAAIGPARASLTVDVRHTGLSDWTRLRNALESLGGGVDAALLAVGLDGAVVTLTWSGPREVLQAALTAAGLQVQDGPGRPVLRLAGG